MSKKKVAVIVDNPLRDLPACTLVATELAERGFEAHLVSFDNAGQGCFAIQPDYVLVNYARITNERLLRRLQSSHILIGVLDTEGGMFTKMEDGTLNVAKTFSHHEDVNRRLSDYFVWGRSYFNYLRERGPFPTEILRLSGTPRTDVLHSSLRKGAPRRDILLINTSFPLANPKFRSAREEAHDLRMKFGYSEEYVANLIGSQSAMLNRFIDLTAKVIQKFPNEKFVLRPHPFENHAIYLERLGRFSNLEIRGDGTIDVWLERSKALIHFECSTAIEACLMGVPAFALKETAALRPIEAVALVTDYCGSEEELIEKIGEVLGRTYASSPALQANKARVIDEIYFKFDGKNYQDIVARVLQSMDGAGAKRILVAQFWRIFYFLRNRAKKLLGKPIVRKEKFFSSEDVSRLLSGFSASPARVGIQVQIREAVSGAVLSKES